MTIASNCRGEIQSKQWLRGLREFINIDLGFFPVIK